jgi:energy-coupling factor transporter transmembrane protein EcfT
MRKADPRVKLLWVTLCTTQALLFSRPAWMAGLCLFSSAGALLLGADLKAFIVRLRRFLSLLLTVALVQVLFVRSGTPLIMIRDFTLITHDGLSRGMSTAMRFFVILCSASVMAGENNRRVIAALTKMGVPYIFSFMLMISLRFLPFFSDAFSDAMTAIQLRGIQPGNIRLGKKLRLYGSLIMPVVADAVAKAQDLATVMEARGFGAMNKRTSYVQVVMTPVDWLCVAVLIGIGVTAFWCYYL